CGPAGDLLVGLAIEDGHFCGIRDIDIDPRSSSLELKALGMTFQSNLTDLLERCYIDDRQAAVPCPHVEPSLIAIDAYVVSVVSERELADEFELRPAERAQLATTTIGYVQ